MLEEFKIQFVAFRSVKERYKHSFAERKATVATRLCLFPRLPMIVTLLIACLPLFSAAAIAQDNAQAETETQTLRFQVVDAENEPIEGVALTPETVTYQRRPMRSSLWQSDGGRDGTERTNEQGEATLVFPVNESGPIVEIGFKVHHDSFAKLDTQVSLKEELVTITLKRGLQIAASAIDAVTKEPIKKNLYATTNQGTPVDWKTKSNGTLVSPVIGEEEKSFRLVQLKRGEAIRFSKLVEITPGEKSRMRVKDLEMVEAITVTGKLGDEVPRPVKFGMVMACVASISESDKARNRRDPDFWNPSWCWESSTEVNSDGTFTLTEIPANSVLQIYCGCRGWANKPLSEGQMRDEFPQEADAGDDRPLPQIFEIGDQDTEITVSMHALGRVSVKVVDQDGQPIPKARAQISVPQQFFYSKSQCSFGPIQSSGKTLTKLRHKGRKSRLGLGIGVFRILRGDDGSELRDFYNEFSFSNNLTDAGGKVVIDGVPPGAVHIIVSCPNYQGSADSPQAHKQVVVKSDENVDVELTLNRIAPESGGEDD